MNRYLMLSAAALLAGTASAAAGTYCFGFATAAAGSYRDGATVYTGVDDGVFHNALRTWVHTNNNCVGATSNGMGILGNTKGFGDYSTMSDDYYGKNYGIFSEQIAWSLPKKIKNGQPFAVWVELNGTTAFEVNSGTINQVRKRRRGDAPVGHGRISTLAGVKAIIEARRAQRG